MTMLCIATHPLWIPASAGNDGRPAHPLWILDQAQNDDAMHRDPSALWILDQVQNDGECGSNDELAQSK